MERHEIVHGSFWMGLNFHTVPYNQSLLLDQSVRGYQWCRSKRGDWSECSSGGVACWNLWSIWHCSSCVTSLYFTEYIVPVLIFAVLVWECTPQQMSCALRLLRPNGWQIGAWGSWHRRHATVCAVSITVVWTWDIQLCLKYMEHLIANLVTAIFQSCHCAAQNSRAEYESVSWCSLRSPST